MSQVPKAFLAHRSIDKAAAQTLAAELLARGIDVWFDAWEISGGDNFVGKMEDGLASTDGGLLFCTNSGLAGSWTEQEYTVLLTRAVEGKERKPFIIPIVHGPDPFLPLFLRVRHFRRSSEVDAIANDILRHLGLASSSKPPLGSRQQ